MREQAGADLTLRGCVPADAEAIERLRVQTWRVAYRGIVPGRFLDTMPVDVDRRRRRIAEHQEGVAELVALADDRLVGWVAGGPSRDEDEDPDIVGEIYTCYVDPGRWRTGIGRRLMAAALARPVLADRDRTTLWVLRDNTGARQFYETFGFRPDGIEQVLDLGGPVPEVRYVRFAAAAGRGRSVDRGVGDDAAAHRVHRR